MTKYKLKQKKSIKNRFFLSSNLKIFVYKAGFCHNLRKKKSRQKRITNKKSVLNKFPLNFYRYCF